MFRIVCGPSSGSIELYLTEIILIGSQMFVVCLIGVWQRNFEPAVCVCTLRRAGAPRTVHTHPHTHPHTHTHKHKHTHTHKHKHTHTHNWFKITLPNTDQAHYKHL